MIELIGGPYDGQQIGSDEASGAMIIATEHFTLAGVDRCDYRINADRTQAIYQSTRRVWPRGDAES